ncbi:MBL fold metallo-hydrolase [Stagnihabitans tardus]|uniref:MBL fold metallo-hydrolase n=1 Tax=Stagnihabitans tardus TaxID=2699202 RepID=A0AAE4YB21_9RHOB|nr:MBL fold metallo-hydrolase [Stagnihabitans tardus]NBZ86984.1 MBL fold metallo-hydrolase [Stagnihabitans tardus]
MITYPYDAPEGFAAVEVAPGIRWLRLPLPWALDHVNAYALEDAHGWTLVDTGIDSKRMRAHWQGILTVTLGGKPVTRLIATHHHPDHIGLAGWFQGQEVELLTSRTAWLYARMLTLDTQRDLSPESLTFQARAGVDPSTRGDRFAFSDVVAPMPLGFTRLEEGDWITAGGRRWQVRLGQGHAPDHVTLWSDDVVIMGDQVLPSISPNIGVYPTEPEADPLGEYLSTLQRFAPLAGDQLILPGHQRPFYGLAPRIEALIAEHEAGLDRLAAHLSTPRTAVGCFPALYRREITPGEFGLALAETLAHLNRLRVLGRAQRRLGPDGAFAWSA